MTPKVFEQSLVLFLFKTGLLHARGWDAERAQPHLHQHRRETVLLVPGHALTAAGRHYFLNKKPQKCCVIFLRQSYFQNIL